MKRSIFVLAGILFLTVVPALARASESFALVLRWLDLFDLVIVGVGDVKLAACINDAERMLQPHNSAFAIHIAKIKKARRG